MRLAFPITFDVVHPQRGRHGFVPRALGARPVEVEEKKLSSGGLKTQTRNLPLEWGLIDGIPVTPMLFPKDGEMRPLAVEDVPRWTNMLVGHNRPEITLYPYLKQLIGDPSATSLPYPENFAGMRNDERVAAPDDVERASRFLSSTMSIVDGSLYTSDLVPSMIMEIGPGKKIVFDNVVVVSRSHGGDYEDIGRQIGLARALSAMGWEVEAPVQCDDDTLRAFEMFGNGGIDGRLGAAARTVSDLSERLEEAKLHDLRDLSILLTNVESLSRERRVGLLLRFVDGFKEDADRANWSDDLRIALEFAYADATAAIVAFERVLGRPHDLLSASWAEDWSKIPSP
ncbi:MAG: hypothetical protein J0I99_15165 [Devosia sp.]|uniref:hypothetical protein n=1 Tax=Devosia sp. TaxID=1871048 RepID=UPI001ACA3CF6|nr:hypothetical protein [Devosia sp.]MBN9317081.1 hypothetical protein [Devosia sp.]